MELLQGIGVANLPQRFLANIKNTAFLEWFVCDKPTDSLVEPRLESALLGLPQGP